MHSLPHSGMCAVCLSSNIVPLGQPGLVLGETVGTGGLGLGQ